MNYDNFSEEIKYIKINSLIASNLGLINNNDYTKYYHIYSLYKEQFLKLLYKKFNLSLIVNRFVESELFFPINDNDIINFDIANFLFVEKLDYNSIKLLTTINATNVDYSNIILNTYDKVLCYTTENSENLSLVFINDDMHRYIYKDYIVIKIMYNAKTNIKNKNLLISKMKRRGIFLDNIKTNIELYTFNNFKVKLIFEEMY